MTFITGKINSQLGMTKKKKKIAPADIHGKNLLRISYYPYPQIPIGNLSRFFPTCMLMGAEGYYTIHTRYPLSLPIYK